MADPPVGPGTNATSWPERVAASAIPIVLGGAAFAVSFSNVRAVARAHDTGGGAEWKSWALAASVELLALGAALEVRRRRARGEANVWPWLVLLVGIVATVAANLDTAEAPGWGTVVAVWPALAYLLAASLKATRPAVQNTVQTVHETVNTPPDESPGPHLVPALPEPEDELLHVARVLIADAAANGRPIARTRLGAKIREAGFQVGAQRALSLYDAVVAA